MPTLCHGQIVVNPPEENKSQEVMSKSVRVCTCLFFRGGYASE